MYRDDFEVCSRPSPTFSSDDTPTETEVLSRLQPMLAALSAKLARGDKHAEADYLQDGAFAVLTAISRSQRRKGLAVHYAARFAKGFLLNRRRWIARREREIAVGGFAESGWGSNSQPTAALSREALSDDRAADHLFMTVDARLLRELAERTLTAKELHALELIHYGGYQPCEAAREMRVSAPRITQLIASAVAKMRTALPEFKLASR